MRRLAIWVHGGVGGGFFAQGQPPVQDLVCRLARRFEVDVYSVLPPNAGFVHSDFRMLSLSSRIRWRPIRWTFLLFTFVRIHLRRPYKAVYAFWGYPAGLVATVLGKVCNIPSVVHLQGGDAVSVPELKYGVFYHPARAALGRYAYGRCSALIALTRFQVSCLKENRVHATPFVVPYGVDTTFFSFKSERFDQPVLRFLHVGNQTPIKGQEVMLKIFSEVARRMPSRLVVVGADYFKGRLMALCVSLGIERQVDFPGPQPHSMMPRFYHDADILLHTPYYEGQGLVFAEAAASGTLIAGTRVGMLSDMGDNCAVVVSPTEAELLTEKILTVLRFPEKIHQMRLSARQWVERTNADWTETRVSSIVNDIIG